MQNYFFIFSYKPFYFFCFGYRFIVLCFIIIGKFRNRKTIRLPSPLFSPCTISSFIIFIERELRYTLHSLSFVLSVVLLLSVVISLRKFVKLIGGVLAAFWWCAYALKICSVCVPAIRVIQALFNSL